MISRPLERSDYNLYRFVEINISFDNGRKKFILTIFYSYIVLELEADEKQGLLE